MLKPERKSPSIPTVEIVSPFLICAVHKEILFDLLKGALNSRRIFGSSLFQCEAVALLSLRLWFQRKEAFGEQRGFQGHDKGTICKWVDLAGKHCREVTDYFLKELRLDRVQVDEIWSYIKKGEKRRSQRFERTNCRGLCRIIWQYWKTSRNWFAYSCIYFR